jgi:7-carboxy-7-deazaguanine synthase
LPAPATMRSDAAELAEVFSSVQGEGLLLGCRQVFIRFLGCNLRCDYCDTNVGVAVDTCRMELTPGRHDFRMLANPVDMQQVIALLERWQGGWPKVHHSISLTGGEPLLHVDLLHAWLPRLRAHLPIYLETNGVLPAALAKVVKEIDYISMDIKLPSSSGETSLWEHHQEFLEVAAAADTAVKVVVNASTEHWELERAARMIACIDADMPLIIQPETAEDLTIRISPLALIELQEIAAAILDDVRIIPQTHRFIGLL